MLQNILSIALMGLGIVFTAFGVLSQYHFKNFYTKASIASLIDTAGFLLLMFGLIVHQGLSFFSLKIFLLIIFVLFLNPLANHYIVRGAHESGYRISEEQKSS